MIRPGFLDSESRRDLIELTRDGSAAHRLARRANALLLLDEGMSCEVVAKALYLDDDTIRTWHRLYQEDGIEGLASFGYEGCACRLTAEQLARLTAWITDALPRTSREIGAWIARECGIEYEGRSGLIALLHRLGMEHRKPTAISRKLDPAKQAAFISSYEALLNQLPADEAVMFADAVHPTHAVRAVGCWAPKDIPVAITQSSGRERLNIHGAIDLETGDTRMLEVLVVNAASTIMLLMAIEAMYPGKRLIHVFLDNARYRHAKLVQQWLARSGCETTEGAKFWMKVFNDLRTRGVTDMLIAVTDGLKGMPEALSTVFPATTLQTPDEVRGRLCIVHLIRNSLDYATWKDRKALAAALRPIYAAPSAEAALAALDAFEVGEWGQKFPTVVAAWRRAWDRVIPFFAFPAEIRRVIYTTNAIESVNARLRKIIKTRGHFFPVTMRQAN